MKEEILNLKIRKNKNYINLMSGFGYEEKHKEIYDDLLRKTGKGFFEFKKDIHVLAAIIGFNLYSKKLEIIKNYELKALNVLDADYTEYYHLIYSVALSFDDNIAKTLSSKNIVKIFNQCAALGIDKLKDILNKDNEGYTQNFEDFLENPEDFLENMFDKEKEINELIENSNWS
ncbi:MAG: hypothetical protein ACRC34_03725 [Cetobacterium sp.]